MTLNITSITGSILYAGEATTFKELLENAVKDHARLDWASLDGDRLDWARLDGAKYGEYVFTGKFIQVTGVSEWPSPFLAYLTESDGLRIMHGCRHFNEAEAVKHWADRTDRKMTRFCLATAQTWAKATAE